MAQVAEARDKKGYRRAGPIERSLWLFQHIGDLMRLRLCINGLTLLPISGTASAGENGKAV